jgi:hypothetical protein
MPAPQETWPRTGVCKTAKSRVTADSRKDQSWTSKVCRAEAMGVPTAYSLAEIDRVVAAGVRFGSSGGSHDMDPVKLVVVSAQS